MNIGNKITPICEYGCGKRATHQFKSGKWCCENNHRKCFGYKNSDVEKERKRKIGKWAKESEIWKVMNDQESIEKRNRSHRETVSNSEWSKAQSNRLKKFYEDNPEQRNVVSVNSKKNWNNLEYRVKQLKTRNGPAYKGKFDHLKKEKEIKYCECGCGEYVNPNRKYIYGHAPRKPGWQNRQDLTIYKCACGCGKETSPGSKYIHGHNARTMGWKERSRVDLCGCGCGKYAESGKKYINKHMQKDLRYLEHMREIGRNALNNPKAKEKHRQKIIDAVRRPEVKQKHKKAIDRIMKDPIYQRNRSEITTRLYAEGKMDKAGRGRSGYYFSKKNNRKLLYRSSYELAAYKILEQMSVVTIYDIEPFSIPYERDDKFHRTIPDILITYVNGEKELIEVKPLYKFKDDNTILKIEAMENYSENNDMYFSVWTEKELNLN